MDNSAKFGFPYLTGEAQAEVLHNEFIQMAQALLQGVEDKDLSAPPGLPADGDSYIVGPAPTGLWSGRANSIAIYDGLAAAWIFVPGEDDAGAPIAMGAAQAGLRVYVKDEGLGRGWSGATWAVDAAGLQAEWIDVDRMYPATTNGAAAAATTELTAGNPNVRSSAFVNATEQHRQFQWKPPKRWNKGTVTFRAFYSHAGAQTAGLDGVAWGLAAVAVGDASNIDVAYGIEVVVTADNAAADQVFVTALSAPVTVEDVPDADKQVYWEISRVVADAADDFDGVGGMRLHGVEVFWTSDKPTDD